MRFKYTYQKISSGFTLIEVLVATALFTIVVTTSVSALIVILDANRKAQNMSTTVNNAFFTFEIMTRLMRTGINYHCGSSGTLTQPQDCASGDNEVYFTDDRGQFVHIWHTTTATGTIMMEVDTTGASDGVSFDAPYPLTAPDFDVEALIFHITGTAITSNTEQPKSTIVLSGVTNAGTPESSSLKLQSTVVQRMLDL